MIYYYFGKIFLNLIYTNINESFKNDLNVLSDEFNKLFFDANNTIKKLLNKKKLKLEKEKFLF
jgi:hypothetical protein